MCTKCAGATEFHCTECVSTHYLDNTTLKTEFKYGECKPCHVSCLTCDGPTNKDCLTCDALHYKTSIYGKITYPWTCAD